MDGASRIDTSREKRLLYMTPRFWVANRVSPRAVDLLFRVASAGVLSSNARHRFIHGGISSRHLTATLNRVRGLHGWPVSWAHTARGYLTSARQAEIGGDRLAAGTARANAALCYHYAQIFEMDDVARKRRLYNRSVALFREAAPQLNPPVQPIDVPWRGISLPGYLRFPERAVGRLPLVVFFNGASTVKEETIRWSKPFTERGLAVLALDSPGSGEAWERVLGSPGQEDIAAALIAAGARHPNIDPQRIAVLGISLRGALAVQLGAACDRLAAAVSVTAPFHPQPYFRHLNEMVIRELTFLTGLAPEHLSSMVDRMSLVDIAPQVRIPLLVVGAGNDLIVPPEESLRLYEAAGGPKHLHFIHSANHVAFSHMAEWTRVAANWLAETMQTRARPATFASVGVD